MVAINLPVTNNIPVAILIFEDQNHQTHYRAYSSSQYISNPESFNLQHQQYSQFIAQIYNKLALDLQNPCSNMTNYGKLKEVSIRFLETPMANRGASCYFSAYNHPHCSYKPVHRQSPIHFTETDAQMYIVMQPELFHYECEHEVI